MDSYEVIASLIAKPGVTGGEAAVAEELRQQFSKYTDSVFQDAIGNVYGCMGSSGPTVLIMAHMDEVGLMVRKIEPNGMLRMHSVAGIDHRILPGSEVIVHGKKPLDAVVGTVHPHYDADGDPEIAYRLQDMVCDTGLDSAEVAELVEVGDFITLKSRLPIRLRNNTIAGKTFDDRACIAIMLEVMELVKEKPLNCRLVCCGTVQEEAGGRGAVVATQNVKPKFAIAIDVALAPTHDISPTVSIPMDKVGILTGTNVLPNMFERFCELADALDIPWDYDADIGSTGCDAWPAQVQAGGAVCELISLPLRYMHTSVEIISLDTLHNCAKLIAAFVSGMDENQEETLCCVND